MKTYKFKGDKIYIKKEEYQNGRTALQLYDAETGEDYLTATVNVPEQPLKNGEICIKTWSENEGVLEFLIKEGIVSESKYYFPVGAGFAMVHVVTLLVSDF